MARTRSWLPPAVAATAAAAIAVLALTWPDSDPGDPRGDAGDDGAEVDGEDSGLPVVVDSVDTGDPVDLLGLVSASDLVVVGTVDSVERGRPIDVGGTTGVESALVTITVDDLLSGDDPGGSVVVEEEGWLEGRRIALDGAIPTEPGDRGIWFLVDTGDRGSSALVSAGRMGRWIERNGVLTGPQIDVGVAIDLQDRPLDEVVSDVRDIVATATTVGS